MKSFRFEIEKKSLFFSHVCVNIYSHKGQFTAFVCLYVWNKLSFFAASVAVAASATVNISSRKIVFR
jgi:hypothetical protein